MPELPEVETVLRTLAPKIVGRTIRRAQFLAPRAAGGRVQELEAALTGQTIQAAGRHGKHLLLETGSGQLDIHLRMTGKLLLDAEITPYSRAVFDLDGITLVFEDVRQFGLMVWRSREQAALALGPDALTLTAESFVERLRAKRGRTKPLLLNQQWISGLGNIYVDEALFRAGIHPLAVAQKISRRRALALHTAIVDVLTAAIAAGGSSISDYVDAEGRSGSFQKSHQVYGRAGLPCVVCGSPIRRMVVGQRGTHYCSRCQKR